jgi:toxin HigB-1
LELAFANRALRQLCENEITAERQLGAKASIKLQHRLADLRAASSVKDVVIGSLEYNEASKPAEVAMDICDGCRLTFCPNHNIVPELDSGRINWGDVGET